MGCYTAKPSGRFDLSLLTVSQLKDYLYARHASLELSRITDEFVAELHEQDFLASRATAHNARGRAHRPAGTRPSPSPMPRQFQCKQHPSKS